MALLTFPLNPNNGDLYPTNPLPGQTQYQWSSTDQTWVIVGTSTGVTAGTYGDAYNVGQFTVDSSGRITFAQDVPIASIITPAGSNEEIQFNDNGVFGANANLTWDGVELYANNVETKLLAVSDSRNATNGAFLFGTTGTGFGQSYIYNFYANRAFDILTTDTSPISFRNASSSTPFLARLLPGGAAELYHNGSKKFETAAAGANVTGNLEATGNLKTRAALQVSNNAQPSFVTGFQAPLAFTQSVVYRLPSGDGAPGNVLSTNGSGLLSWVSPGSATAGGANTQVQFNSSGTLAGSSSLTWNGSTLSVPSISFTGQVSSTSGYFWKGMNPATLSGSSNGAAMGYGNLGFQRYSTSASDVVLIASYQPTSVDTVLLTVGGDFYLKDLSGNNEFTVTGAGNVFIKGSLQASGLNYPTADGAAGEVLTTDGAGNLGWLTTAEVVAVPGSSLAGGAPGQIAFGGGFFYWFDPTSSQWLRVAGNTF